MGKKGNQEDCHKSPGIPANYSGMYTYQRELDDKVCKTGLTGLKNQMEQAEFAASHLINIKIAIDSLLLKKKKPHEEVKIANEIKVQNVLYH